MKKLFRQAGVILLVLSLLTGMLPTVVLADSLDEYEEIEYSVSNFYGTYDGNAHSIMLNVSTPGVSVIYSADGVSSSTNPQFTDAGTYTVHFKLTKDGFYPVEDFGKVQIAKADVSNEINLPSSFVYTGKPVKFSPSHSGIATWEISYSNPDGPIDYAPSAPGRYSVKIIGNGPNHSVTIYSHNFTIVQAAEEIEYTADSYRGVYDGKPHSITLNVATSGVTVTYARSADGPYSATKPQFTDAGTYTVYYKLEKESCETRTGSATVTIAQVDVSDRVSFNKKSVYPCTGAPVAFSPSCDNITRWIFTHYDNSGAELAKAPSEPGDYSVRIIGIGTNHYAQITHAYSIVQTEIEYTASGYSGYYDGEPHSIAVSVTTEGATVSYAASEGGEYTAENPAYTDPGEYTVWFKLEKENCATITDSATVTIIPKEIEYTVSDYRDLYNYYVSGTITLSILSNGVSATYATSEDGPFTADKPKFNNSGEYTVWFRLEGTGYRTVVGSATVTIMRHDVSNRNVTEFPTRIMYSGAPVSFTPKLAIADHVNDVAWTFTYYDENGDALASAPILPGKYSVDMNGEGTNCFARLHHAFTIIDRLDLSDYNVTEFPTLIMYSGAPVSFAPEIPEDLNIDGVFVELSWTFTYYDENGAELAGAPMFPGRYSVDMNGEGIGCFARLHHAFTIVLPVRFPINYSASGYSGGYDGQPHTISLNVASDYVTVRYAVSQNGPFTETLPTFTDAGSYTVWYRLEGPIYTTVLGSATVQIDPLQIRYSSNSYFGDYDGQPHTISLNVTTEGVSVRYATSENGPYTAELPTFTEPGDYAVWFRLEKANYATITKGRNVIIYKLDVSDQVVFNQASIYPYTGRGVDFAPSCEGITAWTYTYYENETKLDAVPSAPGSYRVEISGEGPHCYAQLSHAYSIAPENTKLKIEYSVSDYVGYYDGAAHSITVRVATEGVSVTYATSEDGAYSAALPSFTETGTYTVWFKLEKEGYETVTGVAKVIIAGLRRIEYSVEGYSGDYDGQPHTIALNVATNGVAATYATSENGAYSAALPSFTEPDVYTVWFKLEKEGYKTVTGSVTVTIVALGKIKYTVDDYIGTYDGQPHTISLNVLTEGVDVTYSVNFIESKTLPTFTEPGSHTIHVKLEKKGYITAYDTSCVTIDPGVIEYSARGYSGYADGKAHSIQLYVSTPDAKVSYATSKGGKYSATKPSFSNVGTHTVWYRIEKEHYKTVEGYEVVKLLQPKQDSIVYSVEDYIGAYDGEAHTIALDVTTPNVNVTYATSRDGEYGATLPSFTEPGAYTVWFRLKKSGYETSTGSATVTIEKAEQVLHFEPSVKMILPSEDSEEIPFVSHYLCQDQGDGALSWSFSDPDRMSLRSGNLFWGTLSIDVPYAEWREGYSATITATAAETDHYKAATATLTIVAISSIQAEYSASSGSGSAADVMHYMSKQQVTNQMQETIQMQDIDLTVRPVSTLDNQSLLSASDELRKKLMASAGAGQIGSMAVDVALTDRQTGAELHSTNGDLTLSFTGSLAQSYKKNYKNITCVAVHLKQNSTDNSKYDTTTADFKPYHSSSYSGGTTGTDASSPTATTDSTAAPTDNSTAAPTTDSTAAPTDNSTAAPTDDPTAAPTDDPTAAPTDNSTAAPTTDSTAAPVDTSTNGQGGNIDMATIGNTGASLPRPNDHPAKNLTGIQVYKTEGNLDGNNGLNSTGNNIELNESYLRLQDGLRNNAGLGNGSSASSNEGQLLVQRGDLTLVPTGSFSPTVEYIPCELTKRGVRIPDTSLGSFLLIYGPKEAFSNLLTVRAKDGVFTYDGEGHAVTAEPRIAEGTTLYYSLDQENWQTDAPSFTNFRLNEDGSIGLYEVYVLADNPDCDPAACSYTMTILPAQ